MTMTVTNVVDGADEILSFDGSDVALTNGNSVGTATNALNVNVSVTGSTATASFTGASLTEAQMQTLVDGFSYRNTSDNPSTGASRVVTITSVSDDGGGSDTSTPNLQSTVSLTPVNDPPVVAGLFGETSQVTAGSGAVNITGFDDATVTNVDSADYNGGYLAITQNTGTANGSWGLDGTSATAGGDAMIAAGETVTVGGVSIATVNAIDDGQGGNTLTFHLNGDATNARVETALQSLTYSAPSGLGDRSFLLVLEDNDGTANGGDSDVADSFTIEVTPNPPVVGGLDGDSVGAGEGVAVAIDDGSNATVTDADSVNFDGGNLTLLRTGILEGDFRFTGSGSTGVASGSTVSGADGDIAGGEIVLVDGVAVASVSAVDDGQGSNDLVLSFGPNATPARVQSVIRDLQYSSIDEGSHDFDLTITDASGGATSAIASFTVNIDAAPVNTVPGALAAVDDTALSITGLSVVDVDTPTLATTVSVDDGDGTFAATAQGAVTLSGAGTHELTLNGLVADINNTLATLEYTPVTNSAGVQTVTVTSTDGPNSDTDTFTITVQDRPDLNGLDGGSVTFTEGDAPVALDVGADAQLSDNNTDPFDGGQLRASVTTGEEPAEDLLTVTGGATLGGTAAGSTVSVGATVIGTLANALTPGNDLVVDFNGDASLSLVQELVRSVAYTNAETDNPAAGQRTVTVELEDGDGQAAQTATVSVDVVPVNDAPTGAVTISGTAAQNQTLTANADIADPEGLGQFFYLWRADGAVIDGATSDTLTLTQAQVGSTITVEVRYEDGEGTEEGVTSAATSVVSNVNDDPEGVPVITGAAEEDQALTADIGGISDPDGLGTVDYTWKADGDVIASATSSTFTPGQSEVDSEISVEVSYTDGFGNDEGPLVSAATSPVANVNDAPEGAVTITGVPEQGETLTAQDNLSDADGLGEFSYQWYAAEADGEGGFNAPGAIGGATGETFTLGEEQAGARLTVQIRYTDAQGTEETVTSEPVETADEKIDGRTVNDETGDGEVTRTIEPGEDAEGDGDDVATVPVAADEGGQTRVTTRLPDGIGLTAQGPDGAIETGQTLRERLRSDSADAEGDEDDRAEIDAAIDGYVDSVSGQTSTVVERQISFSANEGAAPGRIDLEGSRDAQEALVIDVSNLPSGTVINLDDIDFVVFIGGATVSGGSGDQVAVGDGSSQFIVLGEGNDELRGGGGDDTVGSRGGDDQLFGGSGDDHVVGGADNDTLDGGTGNDVLQGGASDAGTWRFTLSDGELVSRFEAAEPELAEVVDFEQLGPWQTGTGMLESDARLAFSAASAERLELVSVLYKAVTGELPSLEEYNDFVTGNESDLALSEAAVDRFLEEQDVVAQALEVQVPLLIEAVWGEGAASEALVQEGVDFLNAGGGWGDAMLFLARSPQADALLRDEASGDDLVLVRTLETGESGWSQHSGNDILRGGEGNDRLVGGDGDDWLDGGEGTDVAVYTGSPEDFTFRLTTSDEGQGLIELTNIHSGDTDTLLDIEVLEIGGQYYGPDPQAGAIEPETDHAVPDFVVELVGQAVEPMDLAG